MGVRARAHLRSRTGHGAERVRHRERSVAQAVVDELIPRNPCARVVLSGDPDTEVVIPSTEQFAAIVAKLLTLYYRRLVLVASGTGLQSGELRGLTEDRVDWLRRTVKVDRQLVSVTAGEPVFGPPETKASYRMIPVAQCVIDVMAEQIAQRGAGPCSGTTTPRC